MVIIQLLQDEAQKSKWANLPQLIKTFYHEDPEIAQMDPVLVAEFR